MTCPEQPIIAFLAGELSPEEERRFDEHLLGCESAGEPSRPTAPPASRSSNCVSPLRLGSRAESPFRSPSPPARLRRARS